MNEKCCVTLAIERGGGGEGGGREKIIFFEAQKKTIPKRVAIKLEGGGRGVRP